MIDWVCESSNFDSRYPDEEAGEIPVACVVRKAGSNVKEDDIFAFMDNKVEGRLLIFHTERLEHCHLLIQPNNRKRKIANAVGNIHI